MVTWPSAYSGSVGLKEAICALAQLPLHKQLTSFVACVHCLSTCQTLTLELRVEDVLYQACSAEADNCVAP